MENSSRRVDLSTDSSLRDHGSNRRCVEPSSYGSTTSQRIVDRRESSSIHLQREISLAETLNRVLNKGAVLTGDITISVADIDLLYIGLNLIVSSVETMRQAPKHSGELVEEKHNL